MSHSFIFHQKDHLRDTLQQIAATIYTAVLEALGGDTAFRRADQVLREMLDDIDSSIDDPLAIEVLRDMIDGAEHARACQRQERLAIEWDRTTTTFTPLRWIEAANA